MIRTIIFDIGNVLTDFRWKEFFEEFGITGELLDRMISATVKSPDWVEYDRGVLTEEEILQRFIAREPELEADIRKVLQNVNGMVTMRDYAIPWIQELRAKGYQVLYLSNYPEKMVRECEHALDFIPYMDGGILSYRDRVVKPEPAIYALLIARYNLKPEECVFLDDSLRNIGAAAEYGIHTIHFTDRETAITELKKLGVE